MLRIDPIGDFNSRMVGLQTKTVLLVAEPQDDSAVPGPACRSDRRSCCCRWCWRRRRPCSASGSLPNGRPCPERVCRRGIPSSACPGTPNLWGRSSWQRPSILAGFAASSPDKTQLLWRFHQPREKHRRNRYFWIPKLYKLYLIVSIVRDHDE